MKKIIRVYFSVIIGFIFFSCQPEDGINGILGLNSLTIFSEVEPGLDCQYGGIRIDVGLDSNANLALEENEIENTKFVCEGIDDPISKETRIVLHNDNGGASGTSGKYINNYPAIIKFNIGNWTNISSIIYTANIKSDNANNNAIVDLYNATNFSVINNSILSTNSTEYVNVISNNLLDFFPESEINIYLRLRSQNTTDDTVWLSNKSELIIRQEN
jgi:hypothetical protein|nr:hypothetical protein [uncultured Allomuricauda sp.]